MKIRYRTITEYRVLPPRARIIYPEVPDHGKRCIADADELLRPREAGDSPYTVPGDIASLVFNSQAIQRDASSRNLSRLIAERMVLADRHTEEIKERIQELREKIPIQPAFSPSDGSLMDAEKQVLDLEKQKRDVQAKLWSEIVDLRKDLLGERSEYQGASRRFSFLSGGSNGKVQ